MHIDPAALWASLVRFRKTGIALPEPLLAALLRDCGRSQADLDAAAGPAPITTCPVCGGRLRVRTSERRGDSQIRRLACRCGATTGKRVVPRSTVTPRV